MYGWYKKPQRKPLNPNQGIRINARAAGSTWWGKQWLEAFNNISDANRLPRGRAYAGNGSVLDIRFSGNKIAAEVQGSRYHPYEINIAIPAFSEKEKQAVAQLVSENPDLLSRLLNRELPPELNDACAREGVQIFPRRWGDLKASCSCPDWAMPCKHLAAIIYVVANEIDKNPFLVFDLHQFDLLAALEKAGFSAQQTRQIAATPLASLRTPLSTGKGPGHTPLSLGKGLGERLDSLDFSTIPDCRDALLTILADKPAFYPDGDFKTILKKMYAGVAKFVGKELAAELPSPNGEGPGVRPEIVALMLDPDGQFQGCFVGDDEGNNLLETADLQELIAWLTNVPAGRLAALPDELRGAWLTWRFAESLARHGAFVPQLLAADDGSLLVRWLPALLNEAVRDTFQKVTALLPPGLLLYEIGDNLAEPAEADYPQALLSVFLNHYVQQGNGLDYKDLTTPVGRLFFTGEAVKFEKFETREYPAVMALWLNRFFISEKNTVPVLAVEEGAAGDFEVSVAVEDKTRPLEAPVSLSEIFVKKEFAETRLDLLRDLSTLAEFFPALRQLLADKGRKPLRFDARVFADVLFKTLPVINLFGIRMLLPKALSRIIRPQLSLRLEKGVGQVLNNSPISLKNMLAYQWQVAIGEQDLTAAEFLAMLERYAGLVKIRDEYVYFDEKEMKALAEKLAKPPALSGPELLQIALSEEYEGTRISLSPEIRALMNELLATDLMPLPTGLNANLRPYQHRGYSWLRKNARLGFGSILADDMGLGKTLQVIATLLGLKEEGLLTPEHRALAIVPTTLLTNWQREIARFAPGLTTAVYHGPSRSLKATEEADLVLTSYGVARSDLAKLEKEKWLALVIDEAQNIKNPGAEQSKAVKKIAAPVRIAMSGTPVENRLSEYWSVFDFSNKGYLGSPERFKTNFAIPIEGERDQRAVRRFRKVTQPFVLRRLKTDKTIISDLPDKVEQNQFCQLMPEQAALYQNVVDATMKKIENSEGIERRGLVLSLIMALKQICNHPAQYLKKGKPDPALSGKCPLLLDLVEQLLANDEKALVFTQFREMGDLLVPMLQERFGFVTPFLHGGVSRVARDRMVEDFQTKPSHRLLLLSLKAGGTGLNLTAASQVIHFDLWWNPAVEAQATDRAFRIGQQRNVLVHRFITSATFEEKIDKMIQQKKELANLTVTSGETWIGELSDKELRDLFRLG
ncbi:MAG: DEAD/DEAH box helicase [Saprospiraceae bacterium]|nr:DEAD/DEAH box helicase [Saprospiraceae bacterium]